MSLHLDAEKGQIPETVLLPGDPLRAKYIAEKYFDSFECHNKRRAAYGYSGFCRGSAIATQATGMGIPSASIYIHELLAEYGVKRLVRIGTCGSIQPDVKIGDVILASAASTNSSINRRTFDGLDFAPTADFGLLSKAYEKAQAQKLPVRVGTVLTSDVFYDTKGFWKVWAEHGVLAAEMEAAALYTLAARFNSWRTNRANRASMKPTGERCQGSTKELFSGKLPARIVI